MEWVFDQFMWRAALSAASDVYKRQIFNRSDFGLDRFTSFGVGDEIELEIHVEFMDAGAS